MSTISTEPASNAASTQVCPSKMARGKSTSATDASWRKAVSPQPARSPATEYPVACQIRVSPTRRFCGLVSEPTRISSAALGAGNQAGSCPNVMPELPLRLEPAQYCPDRNPARNNHARLARRKMERRNHGQRRKQPHPAQQVPQQGAWLRDRVSTCIDHPNIPGLHRKCLSLAPEPGEINAENDKHEALQNMPVVHRMSGLTQGAEKITSDKSYTKQQCAFV